MKHLLKVWSLVAALGASAKAYIVPALVVAGWLMLAAGFYDSLGQPLSLRSSIEAVLSSPSAVPPSTATLTLLPDGSSDGIYAHMGQAGTIRIGTKNGTTSLVTGRLSDAVR